MSLAKTARLDGFEASFQLTDFVLAVLELLVEGTLLGMQRLDLQQNTPQFRRSC